jgi:hypothetical protein
MQVRSARLPWYTAGLAVIAAAAVTGCAASSGSSPGGGGSSAAAPLSPLAAVRLVAKTAVTVNSFTGTMNLQVTVKPGAAGATGPGSLDMTGTLAEQLRPTLLVSESIGTFRAAGTSLPGGLTELLTPTGVYIKWSYLTQQLHLAKPWLVIPLSTLSKGAGINLSQALSQATSNGPVTQSQMLAGATSVRQVGTGTFDGVPVTEYTGTVSLDKALSYLPSSSKAGVEQLIKASGLTTEKFTVWVDGEHVLRRAVITLDGKAVTESISTTITSVNQPVAVTVPPASETSTLPGGALS